MTNTKKTVQAEQIRDGQWFNIGDGNWHLAAVNMATMGSISCYVSGRKSSRGMCYRVMIGDAQQLVLTYADQS